MNPRDILFAVILALAFFYLARSILARDKSEHSAFSLDDLLIGDDGKASKAAAVMFTALAASTWVIVYQSFKGTLTDLNFAAYLAAWVAPTVTKIIKGNEQVTQ